MDPPWRRARCGIRRAPPPLTTAAGGHAARGHLARVCRARDRVLPTRSGTPWESWPARACSSCWSRWPTPCRSTSRCSPPLGVGRGPDRCRPGGGSRCAVLGRPRPAPCAPGRAIRTPGSGSLHVHGHAENGPDDDAPGGMTCRRATTRVYPFRRMGVCLDCANAEELAGFYSALLRWESTADDAPDLRRFESERGLIA